MHLRLLCTTFVALEPFSEVAYAGPGMNVSAIVEVGIEKIAQMGRRTIISRKNNFALPGVGGINRIRSLAPVICFEIAVIILRNQCFVRETPQEVLNNFI